MINKRLITTVPESRKYIASNVAFQFLSLLANIVLVLTITYLLQELYEETASTTTLSITAAVATSALILRVLCTKGATHMGFLSAKSVKPTLRRAIYEKLLRLGPGYKNRVSTAEMVQLTVEGIDQLEIYFSAYLPQFAYSLLAPLTLFTVLSFINIPAAVVLLVCVPLIPITIAGVQTFAKRLLSKYWGKYTSLGDSFLENLQGLTTLKIYQADGNKHREMNEDAEFFRKITMNVLTMQLNSITLMDVIAYGGAALGVVLATMQFRSGAVNFSGALAVILLSADFYLPMRRLGSFFHIAMNGMAASDKIFHLLDMEEPKENGTAPFPTSAAIHCNNIHFAYETPREVLHGLSFSFPSGLTAIVGPSGCGKSTLAGILAGRLHPTSGSITVGSIPLENISPTARMAGITYVGFDAYIFKGSIRDNLLLGNSTSSDSCLWSVLDRVNLGEFLRENQGLDTPLTEGGSNLSGGQRQRLALARALLHDSPIYLFDEVTSNVDVESESDMMREIYHLAQHKTVILITHRLANAKVADQIYVMDQGDIVEQGSHSVLLHHNGLYRRLWTTQHAMEQVQVVNQKEVYA